MRRVDPRAGVRLTRAAMLITMALGVGSLALVSIAAAREPVRPTHRPSAADTLRDPALTAGVLPNGMHYYLRVNRYPTHRAEIYLAVNAGSVLEEADQRGYAHFMEHLAFNGTPHFPHTSVVDFLEASGMRFGADVNAHTNFDETIYTFQFPTDDPKILAKGLDYFEDLAGGRALLDSNEVVAERGVVMGEWRLRTLADSETRKVRAHYDTLLYGGSPYLTRQPIGDTTLLETAEPGPIRRFYHDWYRPDLMAIVVVGDFDRAQMLREITRRFGGIPARAHERPRTKSTIPNATEPVVDVYRGPVNPTVEVLWPVTAAPRAPEAAFRQELVSQLLQQHLTRRLLAIQAQPSRPFIVASLGRGRIARPLEVVDLQLTAWPDSLMRGLATVLGEVQRVAQHGVPQATLDYDKRILLRNLEAAAGGALARPSNAYAEDYVQHFLTGEGVLLSPAQELALGRQLLPSITPAVLAQAATQLWNARAGERVFVQLPEFSPVAPPTRAGVLALFDSVQHASIAPEPDDTVAAGQLLSRLPAPGRITSERQDKVAGITEWTLSNGAHVILKPTTNDPDELLLSAWSPGGFSLMPDTLFFTPGRMVARAMTGAAGLGDLSHHSLLQKLRTTGLTQFRVQIGYADESIDLAGSPKESEMLFQLLYSQFTAPKLDTAAIHSWASLAKFQGNGATLQDQIDQIFARGEPRLWPPTTQLAELLRPDQALAAYRNRFGNAADFTFILVGALTPEQARPLVERYIASLPATGQHEVPKPLDVKPFLQKIDRTADILPVPRAQTSILFDGPFPSAPNAYLRRRQELGALTTVLDDRIRIRIREQLGGDYSPWITSSTYELPMVGQSTERYRMLGGMQTAPERMFALWQEWRKILDALRTHDVTRSELARATTIQRRQHETALQSNEYWLNTIETYHRLGVPFDKIVDPFGTKPLTPDELKRTAQDLLPSDVYIHLTYMPEDSTTYPTTDTVDVARRKADSDQVIGAVPVAQRRSSQRGSQPGHASGGGSTPFVATRRSRSP